MRRLTCKICGLTLDDSKEAGVWIEEHAVQCARNQILAAILGELALRNEVALYAPVHGIPEDSALYKCLKRADRLTADALKMMEADRAD